MYSPVFHEARLQREAKTLRRIVGFYCRSHHSHDDGLCLDCIALQTYALERLSRCPYRTGKPVCSLCPQHCFRQREREAMLTLMRYVAPRLLWRHPLLVGRYLLDRIRSRHPSPAPARQP